MDAPEEIGDRMIVIKTFSTILIENVKTIRFLRKNGRGANLIFENFQIRQKHDIRAGLFHFHVTSDLL